MINHEKVFITPKEILRSGEIPGMLIVGKCLPEVWENALLGVYQYGCDVKTQYDVSEDPPSKVATVMMVVGDPFAEPRIHKCIPDSLEGLYTYVQEVVRGVHDGRIGKIGWSYSYHDRLFNWPGVDSGSEEKGLDQVSEMINLLSQTFYTRRAQAITWNPIKDLGHHEPPCLQRIWCQVVEGKEGLFLEMNTHWRSRDAFKAAFMNMFALTELQRFIAEEISKRVGREIKVGRYIDITDNFHIYGSYLRKGEIEGFLDSLGKRGFEERTLRTDDPLVISEFSFAKENLKNDARG